MLELSHIRVCFDIKLTRFVGLASWSGLHVRLYIRSRTVSHGLVRSHTVSHGLVRSLIRLYTDMAPVSVFLKSFEYHTRLLRIHLNGPSVTRIRPWLVRLNVRFTRMANRISRVFCVRQN